MADTPPVQLTMDHWRRQTGAGERTPRTEDYSASQGDKEKNSLGPGRYNRTFVRYVANDDGTPIADNTNALLVSVIDSLGSLASIANNLLKASELVDALGILSEPIIFETAPIYPIGIGAAAAYAILDAMGTTAVKVEVPKAGIIQGAIYYDRDDEGLGVNLWLFDDVVGAQTDNSAFALTDGDLMRVIDVIEFSSGFLDATNGQVLIGSGLNIPYRAPEGFIWCQLQAMGVLNIALGSEPVFKLRIQPSV
mgnify:CR=1 FL=1